MQGEKAVEYLFSSLREVGPRVLVELRDTGGADVTVATEWASRHGLNCPSDPPFYRARCISIALLSSAKEGRHPPRP